MPTPKYDHCTASLLLVSSTASPCAGTTVGALVSGALKTKRAATADKDLAVAALSPHDRAESIRRRATSG